VINAVEVHGLVEAWIMASMAYGVMLQWLCWQEAFTALATFEATGTKA
jgi:hypothetical protein